MSDQHEEVVSRLRDLRRREHACTVEIIEQLVVCWRTRAHLDYGCPSIFEFLVRELKYSHSAASRRYKAVRVVDRFPEALEMLREHRVSLSSLALAEGVLDKVHDPAELLDRIGGKSRREVESIVAQAMPVPRKPRERLRPVAVKPPSTSLFSAPSEPAECRMSLATTLSEADYEIFEKVRAIVSRKKPGASVEDVLVEALRFYLKHKEARPGPPASRSNPESRHVPRATRDAVMIRDGHRCTFVGRNGARCTATRNLQIDHIEPWALGGTHDVSNLRVLCAAHNRHEARRVFGAAKESANSPISTAGGNGRKPEFHHRE